MDKYFSNEMNMLKALAIMLVVSGHLEFSLLGIFPPYSFQIALFFFISGCLFKDKYLNEVSVYIRKRIKSLLIPYYLYTAFYLVVTAIIAKLTGKFWGLPITLRNYIFTPFLNGHELDLTGPLWFVTQLFVTLIFFLFAFSQLKNLKDNKFFHLTFFLLIGILAIPIAKILPLTPLLLLVVRTMFSMFFVYLGYFYTNFIKGKYNIFSVKWFASIVVLQAILWLFNTDYDPMQGIGLSYVLVWAQFNTPFIIPIVTSLTGIWASLFVVKILYPYLKDIKFLQDMGNVTYHIMANHLFIMYLLTAFLLHINGIPITEKANHDIYWIYDPVKTTYLYFIITMIVSTYIGVSLKKLRNYIFNHNAS